MKQLAASEKALRAQIAELETQKAKLADPVYIAAQARERLGFVKPGDIPYQVQLPLSQQRPAEPRPQQQSARSNDPWYTAPVAHHRRHSARPPAVEPGARTARTAGARCAAPAGSPPPPPAPGG